MRQIRKARIKDFLVKQKHWQQANPSCRKKDITIAGISRHIWVTSD